MSQICSILQAWEEKIAMAMWKESFESLPPKIKLVIPLNLWFVELDLKELPKELKYTFLGEGKTFSVIVLFALDEL